MRSIGEILKEERQRLGMNQDEFAAVGGLKRRAQTLYEQDERAPDALYLRALAAIGVDVQYILTGEKSSSALAKDEKELLTGYRDLDIRGKANMLGMLDVVGTTPTAAPNIKYAGTVKQIVEGDQSFQGGLSFGGGKKNKKTSPK